MAYDLSSTLISLVSRYITEEPGVLKKIILQQMMYEYFAAELAFGWICSNSIGRHCQKCRHSKTIFVESFFNKRRIVFHCCSIDVWRFEKTLLGHGEGTYSERIIRLASIHSICRQQTIFCCNFATEMIDGNGPAHDILQKKSVLNMRTIYWNTRVRPTSQRRFHS